MEIEEFEDGSTMEWFSRESLVYREEGHTVQIEYDYFKVSAFKTGRKIFCDSIRQWEEYPEGDSPVISQEAKERIIDKGAVLDK